MRLKNYKQNEEKSVYCELLRAIFFHSDYKSNKVAVSNCLKKGGEGEFVEERDGTRAILCMF